jgi:hypothetical protein
LETIFKRTVALFTLPMHVLNTIMDEKVLMRFCVLDPYEMKQIKYRGDRLIQFVTDMLKEVIY